MSSGYTGEGAPALTVPTNMALLTMLQGQDAQRHPSTSGDAKEATDKLYGHIDRFIDNCTVESAWGNFGGPFEEVQKKDAGEQEGGSSVDEDFRDSFSDPSTAAAFVNSFLVAATGAAVVGGVSESRFHYEEMRTKVERNRNMPSTWKGVKVNSLGGTKLNMLVMNDVPYSA